MKINNLLLFFYFITLNIYSSNQQIDKTLERKYLLIGKTILNEFDSQKWKSSDSLYYLYATKKEDVLETLKYYRENTNKQRSIAILEYFSGHLLYVFEINVPGSIIHFKNATKLEKYLNTDEKFALYNSWANAEKMNNNFINAVTIFKKSLLIAQKEKNKSEIVRNCIGIGMIQRDLGLYSLAEKNFIKAQKNLIVTNEKSELDQYWISLHLGCLYRLKKQYPKSIKYLNIISNKKNKKIDYLKGFFENEKAIYFYETNQVDSSLYYCKKLLNSNYESFSNYNLITANLITGKIYFKKNKNKSAKPYLTKTIELTKEYGADKEAQEAIILLSKITTNNNLSRKYLNYLMEIKRRRYEFNRSSKLFIIQLKELKRNEELLEQQTENKKTYLSIITMISILSIVIIYKFKKVYMNHKRINNDNKKLIELNKKIKNNNLQISLINSNLEQFSSIIAHDIKSSIVTINYLAKDYQKLSKTNTDEIKKVEMESQNLYKYIDQLLKKS